MAGSSPVLGLDFGTTYSSAGLIFEGRVELIRDRGEAQVPSVVYIPERGEPLVGRAALPYLATAPDATVQSIKRILGHGVDSAAVRRHDVGCAYRIGSAPGGGLALTLRGQDYTDTQIAAYVIAHLKRLAEKRFRQQIRSAVVATPVNAAEGYEDAIGAACRLAGLEILELIPEPVAGSLALGLHGSAEDRDLLVADFGGGTFDVSLIEQRELHFSAEVQTGDGLLGGDDFDRALLDAVRGVLQEQAGRDVLGDAVKQQALLRQCESAKRQLSSAREATVTLEDAYARDEAFVDFNYQIVRSWIEPRWKPLIDRASTVIGRALELAGWDSARVDNVVLIGGATLMPCFRRMVAVQFSETPITTNRHAGLAVALGATLHSASYLSDGGQIPVLSLPD